jgi:hypothetical protein
MYLEVAMPSSPVQKDFLVKHCLTAVLGVVALSSLTALLALALIL